MADKQIPFFPKATSMFVHSGNIINWNRLKRKPNLSPTDELCDCVSKALGEYISSSDKTALQYVTEIYKVSTENVEALDENERHEVKVTLKVFICTTQSPNVIQEAVNKVLNELGTSYIETLLLSISPTEEEEDSDTPSLYWYSNTSFPFSETTDYTQTRKSTHYGISAPTSKLISAGHSGGAVSGVGFKLDSHVSDLNKTHASQYNHYSLSSLRRTSRMSRKTTIPIASPPPMLERDAQGKLGCKMTLEKIQPYWEAMECLVGCQKVLSVGICDLNKEVLEDLYTWSKVKPVINQVNLESCCTMPKELTEYAKEFNVQLLTHNDSPVFLTKERLQETLHSVATERDSDAWSPQWAVRYSGIIKCRGIIKMKGYVFHAQRDNKKRLL